MIEDISKKNRNSLNEDASRQKANDGIKEKENSQSDSADEVHIKEGNSKSKISLSDKEFGKY